MRLDEEMEAARQVIERIESEGDLPLEDDGPVERLVAEVEPTISELRSDQALAEVFGYAAIHPNAHFRYHMLDVAKRNVENVFAQEFIQDLTHDDEDFVGFGALRIVREERLQRVLDDLMSFIGRPSERIRQPEGKVGVGGSTVLHTHIALFGTENLDEFERLEDHLETYGHLPPDRLVKPHPFVTIDPEVDPDAEDTYHSPDVDPPDGMVQVPGGVYTVGIERSDLPVNRFEAGDFTTPYRVEIEPFFIDRYPVTNAEYDAFVEATEDDDTHYGHPGEPEDKDRRRNTLHDERAEPDHPVTGIDWYDAYAYANWAGKDLPIEEEWEIAARGKSGNVFPWGDEWDPDRLNWAGNSFDAEIDNWWDWQKLIVDADRMAGYPETMTTPVDAFPEGESEFGVADMMGNAWEYTKTNYYTRQEMCPLFSHGRRKAHAELIEGLAAFPTTKGGTWSSIPEITTAPYRSSDLMTDRHNEIGFRCVKRPTRPTDR